jgi:hypothetical protein
MENWINEYQGERTTTGSKYFSDTVPEGQLSFKCKIMFLDEGEKKVNNFEKEVIAFRIQVNGEEKLWEVNATNFDLLKTIAKASPLVGKTAELERTGTTRKDTRRAIKF